MYNIIKEYCTVTVYVYVLWEITLQVHLIPNAFLVIIFAVVSLLEKFCLF